MCQTRMKNGTCHSKTRLMIRQFAEVFLLLLLQMLLIRPWFHFLDIKRKACSSKYMFFETVTLINVLDILENSNGIRNKFTVHSYSSPT